MSYEQALWCKAIHVNGRLAAIYGLGKCSTASVGLPWLIGTPEADEFGAAFLRQCRPVIASMLKEKPALVNFVHVGALASQRWLRWLGFQLLPPVTIPATGEHFYPFWMAHGDAKATAVAYVDDVRALLQGIEAATSSRVQSTKRK